MRTELGGSRSGDRESAVIDDRAIARIAARQRGLVSRAQLLDVGIRSGAINRRVRSGRLHPVHRGVYMVGHTAPVHGARELAAVLACGPGAVVSHASTAHLLKLLPHPARPRPVDVTVPGGRDPAKRPGIRIHRVESLDPRDTRTLHGIPATAPARTLLDLATVLPPYLLERAIAEAQVRRLVRRRDLIDQLERNRGRRGTRMVRRLLDLERGPAFTRSEAERKLLTLLRAAALPVPRVNSRAEGYEVDFMWREHRLVLELDGFAFHSSRAAFERDRARDAALAAAGYTVIRITWRQLVDMPEAVVARIARALAVRGTRGPLLNES
jgi:very-short-patch-repair endonuclease